jgi:hypothetical protein
LLGDVQVLEDSAKLMRKQTKLTPPEIEIVATINIVM